MPCCRQWIEAVSPELETLRYAIIVASAALLLVALLPVRRLLRDLPDGMMRRAWVMLGGLLLVMIGAEVIYAFGLHAELPLAQELIIPLVLLVGSWFIMLVSQMSAGSIEDVQRTALLERESITDALTGLYNRRHMDRVLCAEMERARRYDQPMSLVLLDVDHFKAINDEFGHQIGDQALKQLARLVQAQSRVNETVARYGGEELAVIMPGADLEQAAWQAERLRSRIASEALIVDDDEASRRIAVTVSVGLTQLSRQDGFRAEKLLERADRALYNAKHNGRNRVESVHPPSGSSLLAGWRASLSGDSEVA